ncbi:unnamed protein product [Alternaria alternata]
MNFSSVVFGDAKGTNGDIPGSERQPPGILEDGTLAGLNINNDIDLDASQQSNLTFLDVLGLLRQYAVPSVDLQHAVGTVFLPGADDTSREEELGQPVQAPHYSHALGGGYSAVVLRHSTKDDIYEVSSDQDLRTGRHPMVVTRAGTVVAFKKISPRPSTQGASKEALISEAFSTICREIEVCRHPLLLNHENICKLRYVAWALNETLPWIALELAMYGTLEDILTAPGEGPTTKQKLNLTIDTALGLAALHHTGVVHGDLKPANILVNYHPTRQIVGQLSDFGGSAKSGETKPRIVTQLWLAPEACILCPNIDWKLADTWSYGLVVASIWSSVPRPQKAQSSCYLEQLLPEGLESQVQHARILLLKTEPDPSPESLISRCGTFPSPVANVLSMVLSCQSANRKTIEALVNQDLDTCFSAVGREALIDYSHHPVPDYLAFKVWSYGYRNRSDAYKEIVYQHLRTASSSMKATMDLENELLEVEQLQPVPSQLWRAYASKALSLAADNLLRFDGEPIIAFQVAISNCCELGVEFNEAELLAWAYTAAKSGHNHAMWMAPLLEDSCVSNYGNKVFRKACLVIGACIGSIPSLLALERTDQTLYDSTLTAIRSKRWPDCDHDHPDIFELFIRFSETPSLTLSTCSLIDALGSHNVEQARRILEMNTTDVTNMTDERGRNILHMLTYMRDRDTEGLALLAYVQGASLEQVAAGSESTHLFLYNGNLIGTPMYWAALKGMSCLVKQLLELHEESGTAVEGFDEIIFKVAFLHHSEVLRLIISQLERTHHLMVNRSPCQDSQQLIQSLLGAALTPATILPLSRRMLHGVDFATARSCTLNLLLDAGANPLLPCQGLTDVVFEKIDYDALAFAIVNKDHASLALLLARVRESIDQSQVQEAMYGKIQLCVTENSLSCLRVLLDIFPEIVNPPMASLGFAQIPTPLNMAARHSRREYALALLELGADVTVWHENFSPLARALNDGYLDTAEVIYNFCDEDDIQRIFGYNETTGATMSGRLMANWRTGMTGRTPGRSLIDAMKWLHSKGGAYFNCYRDEQRPIWEEILFRRASSSAAQASVNNLMLETLFDMFPDKLNQADDQGLFPIHRATLNGHLQAVKSLLDRSVDINAESVGSSDDITLPKDFTALSLAMHRLASPAPFDVQRGGKVEVRQWRETMKEILKLLISRGATVGQHPSPTDFYRSMQYKLRNVRVVTSNERDEDDELEWGEDVWPQRLPSDETSSQAAQEQGGRLLSPMMKSAMRTLLPPIASSTQDPQELLSDGEKEVFAQYRSWLLTKAELRKDAYRQRSLEWNTVGHNEQVESSSSWSPDWMRWHTLSSGRIAVYPNADGTTENDTFQVSHTHRLDLPYN